MPDPNYEYKLIYDKPGGMWLFPWASQEVKDRCGPQALERRVNELAANGWELVSSSTWSTGNFFWITGCAMMVFRKPRASDS